MNHLYRLTFLGIIILLASCAPRPVVKEQKLTGEDVLHRVKERNASIQTLSGKGNITVKSPELSTSGAFSVSMKMPDSLLLVLRGPFGIHVGTLALTKQSFQYYNNLENNVIQGVPDSSTLVSILHIGMPVEEILNALTGAFPFKQDSLLRFSSTEDEYLMAFSHNGTIAEYRIDASTFIVTKYLVKDTTDKVLYEAETSSMTSGNNVATPSILKISFPDQNRSITLVYKKIDLNEDVSCTFTLPEGTEILRRR